MFVGTNGATLQRFFKRLIRPGIETWSNSIVGSFKDCYFHSTLGIDPVLSDIVQMS